jgi:hypothetical protein
MRASLIDQSGLVVNVVLVGVGYTPPDGLTIGPAGGEIGWTWDGAQYVPPLAPPPPPLTQADYVAAIEAHVDETAKAKSYGGSVALASYVNSTTPQWQAEALAFVAWRDAVWASAYATLAAVQGGATPPTLDQLIAGLPPIEWPT